MKKITSIWWTRVDLSRVFAGHEDCQNKLRSSICTSSIMHVFPAPWPPWSLGRAVELHLRKLCCAGIVPGFVEILSKTSFLRCCYKNYPDKSELERGFPHAFSVLREHAHGPWNLLQLFHKLAGLLLQLIKTRKQTWANMFSMTISARTFERTPFFGFCLSSRGRLQHENCLGGTGSSLRLAIFLF